jgi:bidirectional [NiFe] hydrogenase diaphorase subunit
MSTVNLTINGQNITASEGEKLVWVALDNGIYIPNLCAIKDKPEPNAACRLCWVEIAGKSDPVTACTVGVSEGMVVETQGEKALYLARAGFELLMASHALDCAHCPANGRCELQKIAKYLKCSLKPKQLRLILRDLPLDESHPLFTYNPDRCVLCGRCVWECQKQGERAQMGMAHRGFEQVVTTFGDEPMGEAGCTECLHCVEVCPTGALAVKSSELKGQNAKP